jgi:hypothetical protein
LKTTEELELELKAWEASKPTQDNKGDKHGHAEPQQALQSSDRVQVSPSEGNELLDNIQLAMGYILVDGKWVDTKPRKEYIPVAPANVSTNITHEPVKEPEPFSRPFNGPTVMTKEKLDRWEQIQLDKLNKGIN